MCRRASFRSILITGLIAACLLTSRAGIADVVQVDIRSTFNADVVVNNGSGMNDPTQDPFEQFEREARKFLSVYLVHATSSQDDKDYVEYLRTQPFRGFFKSKGGAMTNLEFEGKNQRIEDLKKRGW